MHIPPEQSFSCFNTILMKCIRPNDWWCEKRYIVDPFVQRLTCSETNLDFHVIINHQYNSVIGTSIPLATILVLRKQTFYAQTDSYCHMRLSLAFSSTYGDEEIMWLIVSGDRNEVLRKLQRVRLKKGLVHLSLFVNLCITQPSTIVQGHLAISLFHSLRHI